MAAKEQHGGGKGCLRPQVLETTETIQTLMKAEPLTLFSIFRLVLVIAFVYATPEVVESCCRYKGDVNRLYQCAKEGSLGRDVAIVSFTTAATLKYASYSLAINAAFAHQHGYSFKLFDLSEVGTNGDPRWNKIFLIWDGLQHWAKDYSYVVWLDSDLAIIDHSFNITSIALDNPRAHVIMSRDVPTAPFVSNSGAIIVKNTAWSVALMELWWLSYDRDKCCDQNAFTWLYDRPLPADIREKVALLPSQAINTHFPAWLNQKKADPVLHLAGLNSLYREAVFRTGYLALCAAEEEGVDAAPQLTLNRDYLFGVMRSMNAARAEVCSALIREMEELTSSFSETVASVLSIRRRLLDALKADDDERNHFTSRDLHLLSSIRRMELTLKHWIATKLLHFAQLTLQGELARGGTLQSSRLLHEEVREAIGAVFELCVAFNEIVAISHHDAGLAEAVVQLPLANPDVETEAVRAPTSAPFSLVAILAECEKVLDCLLLDSDLPSATRGSLLYFQFKTYQFLAGNYPVDNALSSHVAQRLEYLTMAAGSWRELKLLNHFDAQYVLPDPYKEYAAVLSDLALLQCLQNNHHQGLFSYKESLELQQQTLLGFTDIKIATTDVIRTATTTLLDTAINAALCWAANNGTIDAQLTRTIIDILTELCTNDELKIAEPGKYGTVLDLKAFVSGRTSVKRLKRKQTF